MYISVLVGHPLSFINIHGCTTFRQDSAPRHKAKLVANWFQTKNVRVLKWPGNSPDLNPIENLWRLIKKYVFTLTPTTLDELKQTIKEIWCKDIDQNVCKNLTDCMPSRIQKDIKNKGYHTNTSTTTIRTMLGMFRLPGVCFKFCYVQ